MKSRKLNTQEAHYVVAGLIHYAGRALERGYITREQYDELIRSVIERYPQILN